MSPQQDLTDVVLAAEELDDETLPEAATEDDDFDKVIEVMIDEGTVTVDVFLVMVMVDVDLLPSECVLETSQTDALHDSIVITRVEVKCTQVVY